MILPIIDQVVASTQQIIVEPNKASGDGEIALMILVAKQLPPSLHQIVHGQSVEARNGQVLRCMSIDGKVSYWPIVVEITGRHAHGDPLERVDGVALQLGQASVDQSVGQLLVHPLQITRVDITYFGLSYARQTFVATNEQLVLRCQNNGLNGHGRARIGGQDTFDE